MLSPRDVKTITDAKQIVEFLSQQFRAQIGLIGRSLGQVTWQEGDLVQGRQIAGQPGLAANPGIKILKREPGNAPFCSAFHIRHRWKRV